MHLYPSQGMSRALHHLRGEFAFALYDDKEESLFLARDRFGIKPLYWTETDNGVVFGSELKVLFANPDVQRKFFCHWHLSSTNANYGAWYYGI